jgi:hypothetical protein
MRQHGQDFRIKTGGAATWQPRLEVLLAKNLERLCQSVELTVAVVRDELENPRAASATLGNDTF